VMCRWDRERASVSMKSPTHEMPTMSLIGSISFQQLAFPIIKFGPATLL
jgi:hypothetical protein